MKYRDITVLGACAYLLGCANTSTIQEADLSKSHFDEAVFNGELAIISEGMPDETDYRIFHQGATGYVSVQTVRNSAEARATEFCERKGKVMSPLQETTSVPPHILGNYPRIEIVFECIDPPTTAKTQSNDDKYTQLVNLKKLLDSGVLTEDEFAEEKDKILNQQ